jgi:hypothetical protein
MLGTAHDEATPLLGRLEEQKLLTLLLDDVAMYGQALVLHGEPGIGESRLLSRSRAARRLVLVRYERLRPACFDGGASAGSRGSTLDEGSI